MRIVIACVLCLAAPFCDGARSEAKTPGNRPADQLHPSRSFDATSPRDYERREGACPLDETGRSRDGTRAKTRGRRDLLGIVSQRKNIFMRLELWHEKSMSFVTRFSSLNVPGFLVQLQYVTLKSLISSLP